MTKRELHAELIFLNGAYYTLLQARTVSLILSIFSWSSKIECLYYSRHNWWIVNENVTTWLFETIILFSSCFPQVVLYQIIRYKWKLTRSIYFDFSIYNYLYDTNVLDISPLQLSSKFPFMSEVILSLSKYPLFFNYFAVMSQQSAHC